MTLHFGIIIGSFINKHVFLTDFSSFLDLFIQINQAMILALTEVFLIIYSKNIFE